jgi:hypothetical protein
MKENPYDPPRGSPPKPPERGRRRVSAVEIAIVLFGLAIAAVTAFLLVTTLPDLAGP